MDITAPAKICASLLPLIYLQKISIGNFDEQVGLVALVAKWFRFEGFLKKGRLRREVVMMMRYYYSYYYYFGVFFCNSSSVVLLFLFFFLL